VATKRILLLSNLPTPYQLDFLEHLSKSAEIRAVFLSSREANRDWALQSRPWMRVLKDGDSAVQWNELLSGLAEFEPDHVIVGGYRLPLANKLKWFCWRRRIQYFYWLEKPLPTIGIRAFLRSLVWRITLPFSAGVLCIGSEAARAYGKYAPLTFNLPYSIDASRYRVREARIPAAPLRCLFVGQYVERKGVCELLAAFAAIKPEVATLTMVGSGDLLHRVEEYAGRNAHIHNLGFVEPAALAGLFAAHHIFVLPSRHDGWAVVVAEAMAAALPIVGTRMTGAFVDLVAPNGCGKMCEVDAESIRVAVEAYAQDPESVLRDGQLGRQILLASSAESENAARALLQMLESRGA
jgi:glycosyltransferase involved in cell wall biosynthesis